MSKKNQSKQVEKKKNTNFAMAVISLLLAAALLVVDIHILVNKPGNLIGLLGTTVLMLVWMYFFVRALFLEIQNSRQETASYLEGIIKSEKAFFIMQRKLEKELQQIGEYSKVPSEEIITAQKAIAKVTINRSKENTDALMNSNDQVLDKLIGFQDILTGLEDQITERQKLLLDNTQRDIIMKQQEIVSNMREMELSIKNEVLKAVNSINAMQSKTPVYVQEPAMAAGYAGVPKEKTAEPKHPEEEIDFRMPEEPVPEATRAEEEDMKLPDMDMEPDFGMEAGEIEDLALEDTSIGDTAAEAEAGIEESGAAEPDFGIGEESDSPVSESDVEEPEIEELGVAEPDFGIAEEPEIEDLGVAEPDFGIAEEPFIEEPEIVEEAEVVEEEPQPEPQPEEKPAMPDLSDPNKLMTPEEIAALIANM